METYWDKTYECMLSTDLAELQASRLRDTIGRAGKAPWYRSRFAECGLSSDSIRSVKDLSRFPLTGKEDLRNGFPYGMLSVPLDEVVRLHASSGTTGTPTAVYHTRKDIEVWADSVARCLYMAGVRSRDVFQNIIGYGLFTGGLGLHYGAEKLGTMVIPSGVGNSRRQVALMRQFGTTVIHIIPSYALKLLETFEELGLDPAKDTRLRIAVVGAEPHTEETRRRIEESYGVFAANSYGLSEMNGPGVAFECPCKTGLHVWEDRYVLEVLDPQSLEPVPEGEAGEIVLTTLTREAMPLIRYRTRDLARIVPGACPCGRTHRRISRIMGRTDDMFIIKGVNIYPMQIEQVLMAYPEVGNNYVVMLEREKEADRLKVRIEMSERLALLPPDMRDRFGTRLVRALHDELLVTPEVELVEPGKLPSAEGKAVRVIDRREPG